MKVFVYGTLKKGHGLHGYISRTEFISNDSVDGFEMYDLGAFPCIVQGEGTVHGEVYEIDGNTLHMLDRVEGYPSLYNRMQITTNNGHECHVYYMEDKQNINNKIETGIWT